MGSFHCGAAAPLPRRGRWRSLADVNDVNRRRSFSPSLAAPLTVAVLTALVPLVVAEPARAQESRVIPRSKPFAEMSASARRLRDSLVERAGAVVAAAPALLRPASVAHEALLRDSVLAVARSQLGTRYQLGAQSPGKAFDCSGLVRFVLAALRLELPRTAATQALAGQSVERDTAQLRPGDLLTFGRGRRVTHIGIYVGGGRFIHASSSQRRVVESTLRNGSWYVRNWLGARRVLASADSASSASVQPQQ